METQDSREAAAAWSNLAEPGDAWAGALRHQLGDVESLQWATGSYRKLPADVEGPEGQRSSGAASGWRAAHRRWEPRAQDLDVSRDLDQVHRLGGRLVTPQDTQWPHRLDDLGYRCPPALWVVGSLPESSPEEPSAAIVGSRAATSYGTRVAAQLAFDLSAAGVVVISGGAYGIDSAAHRGALEARTSDGQNKHAHAQGPPGTICVICGGLANLYPSGNESLFERIVANGGALVAEVPPRYRPARWRFLERNRLIAAWSDVTIVPEAGLRSGALATANRALDLGRDVAAVPGPVTSPASKGPHSLIRDGAALVSSARDVIDLLVGVHADGSDPEDVQEGKPSAGAIGMWVDRRLDDLGPAARRAYEALPVAASATTESVARTAGLSAEDTARALLSLHFSSLVSHDGKRWARAA